MLNSHRSLSSTIKKSDKQRDIKSQIYKYSEVQFAHWRQHNQVKENQVAKQEKKKKKSSQVFSQLL